MQEQSQYFSQGDSTFELMGPAGVLEVMTTWPKQTNKVAVGIICHPHPLHQGTMHNKVVTTIAKAFDQIGLATVRFNFRGVGKSAGEYGYTVGESDDLRAVLQWVNTVLPNYSIWLAGFSFGAYITAKVANQQTKIKQLVTVAPAVTHHDFTDFTRIHCPWLVIHGDQDDVIPLVAVKTWVENPPSPLKFIVMKGAGHFFHERLIELKELLVRELS